MLERLRTHAPSSAVRSTDSSCLVRVLGRSGACRAVASPSDCHCRNVRAPLRPAPRLYKARLAPNCRGTAVRPAPHPESDLRVLSIWYQDRQLAPLGPSATAWGSTFTGCRTSAAQDLHRRQLAVTALRWAQEDGWTA